MQDLSFLSNAHPSYIDQLYKDYIQDPNSVDEEWKRFFTGFDFALKSELRTTDGEATDASGRVLVNPKEYKVVKLIYAYRNKAHLVANTNPIRKRKDRLAHLDLSVYDLGEEDMDSEFYAGYELGLGKATLRDILTRLQQVYTRTVGWEYNYIDNKDERQWLRDQIERRYIEYEHPFEKKKRILQKLNDSAVYERFLGTKFIGQKRFSLEGGESTIPALDAMINVAANEGCKEVVIGMAHRGRLNVLVNIVRKTYEEVFEEFEGHTPEKADVTGDVKYHKGYSSQYQTMDGKEVYINLLPNPSHLEAVNPVMQGFCRAKADEIYQSEYDSILPIAIHGDAAVAGQGVVYETLQMSLLKGYKTGGTVHFVINNQIGFTTDFDDARSSYYSTSIASTLQCPVFHVNGDDVEAVAFVSELAVEYRQKFNKDVFVDMVCYRKHGHNEGDDPHYTQPQMYGIIKKHQSVRDIYSKKLVEWGVAEAQFAKDMEKRYWDKLQKRLDETKQHPRPYKPQKTELAWKKTRYASQEDFEKSPITKITKANLVKVIKALVHVPEGFSPLRKINRMLESRREIMRLEKSVDWAAGELLAYGSILLDGKNVRMSGQDVKRGTFSHRHAMLYDEKTGEEYNRLNHIVEEGESQGDYMIFNSHLSEYAVLGFEYGYSLTTPEHLVVWEAQFGDFINGAQIVIDQFLTASEVKWARNSGMILLLPHGYEGAGPEHSSARLERFLQACAELNMVVTNITTPANFFHAIRRQLAWDFRKPLINMSPKSLLRHPDCSSDVKELYEGRFQEIIDDELVEKPNQVKRLVFCSGKVYYDLLAYKRENERNDVALVRLEQLYPLAGKQFNAILKKYSKADVYWVQEEPANMGAWTYINNLEVDVDWNLVARPASASTATGFAKIHNEEQAKIVDQAFNH